MKREFNVPEGVKEKVQYVGKHAGRPFYEKDGMLLVPQRGTLRRVESKSARAVRRCLS